MSAALRMVDGVKAFGGNRATDGVSLDIAAGQIHAVIGPNGAGKSTLFAAFAGEHRLDSGAVYLDDRDITSVSAHQRVRLGIGRAFQVARVFSSLSVAENVVTAVLSRRGQSVQFWSRRAMRDARVEADQILEQLRLHDMSAKPAKDLSQGDRKRLEIAVVLALEPSVLLLDEPTAGMSPEETEATTELVGNLWRERGLTVLITEHDMDVVFALAHTVTVLHRGQVLCTGEPEEVRRRDDVAEVYLGGAQ